MKNMITKEMTVKYNILTKKERLLVKDVNNCSFLINSLLGEVRGLGEKLDVSFAKETLLRFQREKSKLEADLVSIRFDKSVLNARLNSIFNRVLESNTIDELFTSLNDKYENYGIPVEFTYEYVCENDDVKNVAFYKANLKKGGLKHVNNFEG